MVETIQIEMSIGSEKYKLIGYEPIGYYMIGSSGLCYHDVNLFNNTFKVDVHIPTYLNYDKHTDGVCFIIDQVIKQINRTNKINKLLNGIHKD